MKKYRIRRVILFGALSLVGIIIFQVYWVNKTFSVLEQQFNQSVKVALLNVARNMAAFNDSEIPNQNPVKQLSYNYFVVDLNDFIDPKILQHFLTTEFSHSNLEVDYEYAIYDCASEEMVYGDYISKMADQNAKSKGNGFPKFDEYLYYFGVRFPGKTVFVLSDTKVWYVSAFVLVMAILFFAYATIELIRQRRLSEIQKDFINNMTHEFKTPISTIGISAKVLSENDISHQPKRLKKYAEIIAIQNQLIEEKIERILQSSLSERPSQRVATEIIQLEKTIAEVVKNFKPKVEEKGGQINFPDLGISTEIPADKFHFSNILYNLLDNAVKYCEIKPLIDISLVYDAHSIEIKIKDNGIGIDHKFHKKIFHKFYRISTGDVHNVKGFGLGLNYVKNMVKAHAWKISLRSAKENGSEFIIKIPQKA
jgi:two-component system, OmpR family, phosphate regulon sensor histidine kinase PhoR